ncbi:dynamin family protein [Massilia sp. BSC265]|uniref:dynamin family protein n=1 Tax=Massilia sp. BSC265 TaxID=1549812 RepID=UPI0004E87CC8|nr:dynamin family protein [Massilia sp. BSC265]KFI08320.1 hypothetical protein JN27_05850 [Massilia sp. BSC265]
MKELQQILNLLDPHAEVIEAEALTELQGMEEKFSKDLASAREEGRNLRIAVIGQMKSGKSSFLNAALFNQVVLPKAETPMTAALTSIVYGSQSRAEVQFYSREDWAGIQARADEYAARYVQEEERLRRAQGPFAAPVAPTPAEIESHIDPALTACAELVRKAREKGLDPDAYFGQTRIIDSMQDVGELAHALQDYVGAGGHYTPITKMTTLHLNDERLKGLEVIDTPGFNDPVVSRGAITRSYLARCDVIFLLSQLGQFLGASDMQVFREQLPEAGLGEKAVFLVGTQRDLTLRQDGKLPGQAARIAERYPPEARENATLQAMLQLLDRKMSGLAEEAFARQVQGVRGEPRSLRLLEELKNRSPRFISSWAWLVAQDPDNLSPDDRNHYADLCRSTGISFDVERLTALSNIPLLANEIVAQGERKRELLAAKERQLADSLHTAVKRCLEDARRALADQRRQIQGGTIAELERLEQQAVSRLEKGRLKLEDVFDEQAVAAKKKFAMLKNELAGLSRDYAQIESVKGTRRESYKEDTSIFGGFFGHTWETRYRDVDTVYASVQDAIEKIDRYAHECMARFQERILGSLDLEQLRRNLSAAAMALFDTGSADFDGELMLSGINKSLRRITIPSVDFGKTDFTANIVKEFGTGQVSDDAINGLKQAHRAAIMSVAKEIGRQVDSKTTEIEASLQRSAERFVTDMSRDIQAGLQNLREQRADREAALQRIDAAARAVERALALM